MAIKYFKGEYNNRPLPKNKIKINKNFINLGKNIGSNSKSEIYRFTDKSNNTQTIFTTNHTSYISSDQKSKDFQNNPLIRCKYCQRNNMSNPIGIPVSMEINDNNNVTFVLIDPCCDFGCTFSHLKRTQKGNRYYKGNLYMNAEQILHCLYYRVHPDKCGTIIKEKPDSDLLKSNGGPLTDEEFDSNIAKYFPIPNITILPAKKQYIKLNLNTIK